MSDVRLHPWDVSPDEAVAIQRELAARVVREDRLGEVRSVAGVDVGFGDGLTRAAVALLSYPALELLAVSRSERPTTFPYVPGLLSFREAPAVLDAYEALGSEPDLLVVDGHGYAHPRRFGIACHLGVLLDKPTIGCAKSILVGRHGDLGDEPGAVADLVDRGEVVGLAVRTKAGVKPVYVSVGNRLSLGTAADYVLACARGLRLPEPQRQAHLAASAKPRR
jgi:deoxyribonuclease V